MRAGARRPAVLCALLLALLAVPGAAQAPRWPSSGPPRPLAAREVQFPPYELRKLPNGLQVVVVVHDEQPVVSLRAIVQAGGAQDPEHRPGVAAMVATLLDQGTATLTAQQIAERIDVAGGDLGTGLGRDLSFARAVLMKDDLALGMMLLADILRNPSFAPQELERQRQQTLSALKVAYQDPEYLAGIVFDRLVYGAHPYGFPGNGTVESVQGMTRDELVSFHQAYYAPNNTLLAIVGDVTVEGAMALVTRAFGDWASRDVPPSSAATPPDPARRVIVIDKPGAAQTEIRAGHVGVPRKTDDYRAVDLLIKVLGGEGANRLYRVLRAERGLTYSASAEIESLKRSGQFVAQTSTRSETTGEALRLMVDEFSRLRREGVGENELAEAKAYLTGHFPLTIETPDEIGTHVLNALFYELPLDELETFRQRVNAVAVEDIERAALRSLRPDRLSIVLVGDAAAFVEQLPRVGFGKYEVVRLDELDVMAPDFRRKR
ncbi:MAG TPA: pitrilysin family protein [Vicinamibacterales bacterium]|nr:pitrilysin family protein [Vicinamibacterales bacterium]